RRHTRWPRDWSSDVCSSDLQVSTRLLRHLAPRAVRAGERHGAHPLVGDDGAGGLVRQEYRPEQITREAGVVEDGFDLERTARHEIGRASCRERGEMWVVCRA